MRMHLRTKQVWDKVLENVLVLEISLILLYYEQHKKNFKIHYLKKMEWQQLRQKEAVHQKSVTKQPWSYGC